MVAVKTRVAWRADFVKVACLGYQAVLNFIREIQNSSPSNQKEKVSIMTTVEKIQFAIKSLSPEDYAHLRQWFFEKDWEQWDRQIENDTEAGKLDFLIEEAFAEKAKGQLKAF